MSAEVPAQVVAVLELMHETLDPSVAEVAAKLGVSRTWAFHFITRALDMGLAEKLPTRRDRPWRITPAGLKAIGRKAPRAA